MKYQVMRIEEDLDFGCEERGADEPVMAVVVLKDERIPSVKKKFSTKAPLAIIPEMNPYIEHI